MSHLRKSKLFAIFFNLAILITAIVGTLMAVLGFSFYGETEAVSASAFFEDYDNDINLIAGFFALLQIPFDIYSLITDQEETPKALLMIEFVIAVNVIFSFWSALVYVAPLSADSPSAYWSNFWDGNHFLFRVLNPFFCSLLFIFFESSPRFSYTLNFFSLIPVGIYGIYYTAIALSHSSHGRVDEGYDPYGYAAFGVGVGFVMFCLVLLGILLISFVLWYLRNRTRIRAYGYDEDEGEEIQASVPDAIISNDEESEEIISDDIIGHLGKTDLDEIMALEKKEQVQEENSGESEIVKETYTTDTGTIHTVTKRVRKHKYVFTTSPFLTLDGKSAHRNRKEENNQQKTYHVYRKGPISHKWLLRASKEDAPLGVFSSQEEAVKAARKVVKLQGGTIKVHYRKVDRKAY